MPRSYHPYLLILLCGIAGALSLGAISIRPFVLLWYPWALLTEHAATYKPPVPDLSCERELRDRGVVFSIPSRAQRAKGGDSKIFDDRCTIDTPVTISHLSRKLRHISKDQGDDTLTISCHTALKLERFISLSLIPTIEHAVETNVSEILHKGGFSCPKGHPRSKVLPDLAHGLAFTFAGVALEDGSQIMVARDYSTPTTVGEALRTIAGLGCAAFGISLAAPAHPHYRDHIHLSTGFPQVCAY